MNALTFAIGGFLMVFVTAYADFWSQFIAFFTAPALPQADEFRTENKSLLVSIVIACYGAFTVPVYWLREPSVANFNTLISLYIVFGILTFAEIALTNIYLPYCMERQMDHAPPSTEQEDDAPSVDATGQRQTKKQRYGLAMSVYGQVAVAFSGSIMLGLVTIIAATLEGNSSQSAGLLVTTIFGFVTIAGTSICLLGLPTLPHKPLQNDSWRTAVLELLVPFTELLLRRRNMLFLLVAYTIYTDTLFALGSITGQLFFATMQPGAVEFSLYSLSGNLFNLICTMTFFLLQRHMQWNLEHCLIVGYALILVVPVWGCIGLSDVDFGFKVSLKQSQPSRRTLRADLGLVISIDGSSTFRTWLVLYRRQSSIQLGGYCTPS
jgi:hypothetical protein